MDKYKLERGGLFLFIKKGGLDSIKYDYDESAFDPNLGKGKISVFAVQCGIEAGLQRETDKPQILLYSSKYGSISPENLGKIDGAKEEPVSKKEFFDEFYQKLSGSDFVVIYEGKEFSLRKGARIKNVIKISTDDTNQCYCFDVSRTADDYTKNYIGHLSFKDLEDLEKIVTKSRQG